MKGYERQEKGSKKQGEGKLARKKKMQFFLLVQISMLIVAMQGRKNIWYICTL